MTDVVNHPTHYTQGAIECIEAVDASIALKAPDEAICVASILQYLWRYETKNGLQDILKAQWYLNRLIDKVSLREKTEKRRDTAKRSAKKRREKKRGGKEA